MSESAPDRSWLIEEFARAKQRAAQVPPWARPVVTRPLAHRYAGNHVPGRPCPCFERDTWEGTR